MVRDFYPQKNSGLILYHYDLANLLINIGFNLKALTVWIPGDERDSISINNPNVSIINDYFLILRKEI